MDATTSSVDNSTGGRAMVRRMMPTLWFNGQAEDAAAFYVDIFPRSRIVERLHSPSEELAEPGSVVVVVFELNFQRHLAINTTETRHQGANVSLAVECDTQRELDHYWHRLIDGGRPLGPGLLCDRFGITWQIFPSRLLQLLTDPDDAKAAHASAMVARMQHIRIEDLEIAPDLW